MEETMEANRESDIRERMQLLFSQLMESVSNLHEALIWELPAAVGSNRFGIDPLSMYTNGAEINQVQLIIRLWRSTGVEFKENQKPPKSLFIETPLKLIYRGSGLPVKKRDKKFDRSVIHLYRNISLHENYAPFVSQGWYNPCSRFL
ncbi:hypothetical protein Tco_0712279 [Tanacetum coccineum]